MAALLPLFRRAARAASPDDAELLDRFADSRDEDAFAELVRRHGPVVYRVCLRLVDRHSADDAFQATFLVLATRLDAARASGSVGGWLVGVAGRVARQMRRAAGRRARHEHHAASQAVEQHDAPELTDTFRVLDEELARLPARLRDPVVLCLLQGRTQEQAAAELGRDARTLRRRLGRAKEVLRARLERRGVVPLVAASLVTGGGAVSAVPVVLIRRTTATVFDFLTGGATRSLPVVLAKGVAMTTFSRKLTQVLTVAVAGFLGVGVLVAGDEKPRPRTMVELAPPPKTVGLPPTIQIEGLLAEVPSGFCERCGLDGEQPGMAGVWSLSRREVKMFTELLRLDKACKVQSRPKILVADNQTGYIQVGQDVPYVVSTDMKEGKTVQTIDHRHVGITTRVTPRLSADGRTVLLQAELQHSAVSPALGTLKDGVVVPGFSTQTCQTTVAVPDGGTAVIRFGTTTAAGGKVIDHLWMLTPSVIRGKEPPVAPLPKPVVSVQMTAPPGLTFIPANPTIVAPPPLPHPTPVKP